MKHVIVLSAVTALLVGCSSVSEKIPTVKLEKKAQTIPVQTASYGTSETRSEASMVCENDNMRANALDGDDSNDIGRIVIVQDEAIGSNIIHEVEVDCRDYFLRKSVYSSQPRVIQSSTPTVIQSNSTRYIETEVIEEPRQVIQSQVIPSKSHGRYYIVNPGDTVWSIARRNCTSVEAISRLNGLGRGNIIDVDQRLELPDPDC